MTSEQRIERLEKQIRIQSAILGLCVSVFAIVAMKTWGMSSSTIRFPELRTQRLTLVNEDGKKRGAIAFGDYDSSIDVEFANRSRAGISMKQNGISLDLWDHQGNSVFSASQVVESGKTIVSIGGVGDSKAGLMLRLDGDVPQLTMFNKFGNAVWSVP